LLRKLNRNRLLGQPRRRQDDNIKWNLQRGWRTLTGLMWLRMRIGGGMRSSLFRVLRQHRFVVSPDVSEQVIGLEGSSRDRSTVPKRR
jgi:hypothetical protein